MSTDDLIGQILEERVSPESGAGGLRSRADEIIDAVRKDERELRHGTCFSCGSSKIRKIRPLGGGVYRIKCRECFKEAPIGGIPSQCIETPKQLPHGAYYSDAEKPMGIDKSSPKFRSKSKSKR
jgi:hypothetical protein